jgi:hypothetical protein
MTTDESLDENQTEDEVGAAGNGSRGRSSIAFPYSSLKDAEEIARALHESWGGQASPDQLAGTLNTTPRSGTFRMKLATSRTFGAISSSRGKIAITDRGKRLIDPQSQAAERVEAFLAVPLFEKIFSEYQGNNLPPDEGLEKKMADLGVAPKQTAKARQALQRSAEHAGFFKTTKGRLIRPPVQGDSAEESARKEKKVNLAQSGSAAAVPFPEMWLKLLDEGQSWSAQKTQDFVAQVRKLHQIIESDEG